MFFFLAMGNNREVIQACSIILPPNCAGIIYHRKKVPQNEYELLQTISVCLQEGEERKIQKPWTGRSSELRRSDQVLLPEVENERKLYAHRSMIFSLPPGSQHPISPVCNQPSSLRISRLRHHKQRHSWVSFCDDNRVGKRSFKSDQHGDSVENCWITKDTAILTRKYACTSKSFLGWNAISCFYNLSPTREVINNRPKKTVGERNQKREEKTETFESRLCSSLWRLLDRVHKFPPVDMVCPLKYTPSPGHPQALPLWNQNQCTRRTFLFLFFLYCTSTSLWCTAFKAL